MFCAKYVLLLLCTDPSISCITVLDRNRVRGMGVFGNHIQLLWSNRQAIRNAFSIEDVIHSQYRPSWEQTKQNSRVFG